MTDFLKNRILPLLDTKGKTYEQAMWDFSDVELVIKKEKQNGKFRDDYKNILDKDLFEYKMSKDEVKYVANVFKAHIFLKDLYYMPCLSELLDFYDKKDYNFLLDLFENPSTRNKNPV